MIKILFKIMRTCGRPRLQSVLLVAYLPDPAGDHVEARLAGDGLAVDLVAQSLRRQNNNSKFCSVKATRENNSQYGDMLELQGASLAGWLAGWLGRTSSG